MWNSNKNSSRQKTIKYLGKASSITIEDIPEDYRNDPKIVAFMTLYVSKDITKNKHYFYNSEKNFSKPCLIVILMVPSRYMKSIWNCTL